MKKLFTFILSLVTLGVMAQVTTSPAVIEPGYTGKITITFDPKGGNGGMASATKCYAHTGYCTKTQNWLGVKATWRSASAPQLTKTDDGKWELEIDNMYNYYNIPAGTEVYALAFVFNDGPSGSKEGKTASNGDIFVVLGEENSVMRTILTPNMMETLARNYNRKIEKVKAFEIGNTFMASELNKDHLPDEDYSLCIGMYGKGEDFFSLKGVVCELLAILGIREPIFTAESEYGPYHPGRCARISVAASEEMKAVGVDTEELGIMGEIHPDVAEK